MTPQFRTAVETYGPRFMSDLGLDRLKVSAMFGNFAVESDQFRALQEYKPAVRGSKGGWGWPQWTGYGKGGRRGMFERWADGAGYKRDDPEGFYQFILVELRGSEKAAFDALKRTKTLDSATEIFMRRYERPGQPHLQRRKDFALEALRVLEAKIGTAPAPEKAARPGAPHRPPPIVSVAPVTLPDLPATPVEPVPAIGPLGYLWDRLRGRSPLPATTLPPAAVAEDNPTLTAQRLLKGLGYTEVGTLNGVFDVQTRAAALAFQADNGLPLTGAIDDTLLAALAKGKVRIMEPERVSATKADLRQAAPEVTRHLDGIGLIGKLLLGASGVGAVDATGALDSVKATADQATAAIGSVRGAIDGAVGVVQWTIGHWWIVGIVAGVYVLAKAGMAGLRLVVLLRQGRLL